MYKRTETKPIYVGNVKIGGQDKVVIQSMCNTKTKDIKSTVEQIIRLENAGCEIVRVACLDIEDAKAIKEIKKEIHIPIVADIHFDYRIALQAIESGVDKIRINPGNIGSEEKIKAVVDKCKEKNIIDSKNNIVIFDCVRMHNKISFILENINNKNGEIDIFI